MTLRGIAANSPGCSANWRPSASARRTCSSRRSRWSIPHRNWRSASPPARLNIPTILVIGGYQQAGEIDGDPVDVEDVWSTEVGRRFSAKGRFPLADMLENAIRGPSVCAGMTNARAAGRRIVEMVHEDLKPRQILTEGAGWRDHVRNVRRPIHSLQGQGCAPSPRAHGAHRA
jgi:hypothetical protein